MFARSMLALALAAAPALPAKPPAAPRPDLAVACKGKDGWNDPAPPAHIHGTTYMVGTCGIPALLVTSRKGHVLVDAGTAEAAPLVAANIKALGFKLRDIKWIVNSHEHVDHAGGLAAMKRLTGAKVAARRPAVAMLIRGETDRDDPQSGIIDDFPPVQISRVIADGEQIIVGPLALTAHATPGHTQGGTSWSWRSCEGKACLTMVYADSLSAVSRADYRFTDHPALVATFRSTFAKIAALPCDLLITPHPSASNLFDRLSDKAPLVDPAGCRTYAATASKRLDERLARDVKR
ncbi:MAG: subclass B3 metallo-beta-lactamase [Pseudomonadota bacterium]|nr:subclass B3 metallo-beta-lactamase [Pseudomonadota bacterium]